MVVLLIMAILLAIAIPTFLGVKGGAQDRAAQSDLNTALTNAKALYGNDQSYGTLASAVSSLTASEASLTFVAAPAVSKAPGTIGIDVASDGNGIIMYDQSQSGVCWAILTNEVAYTTAPTGTAWTTWPVLGAGTYYASWTANSSTNCAPNTAATWHQNSFPSAA
jgi:type IV pilus assembly protein PilA